MNEAKQKAMQDVVEAARWLTDEELTPTWERVNQSWMIRSGKISSEKIDIVRDAIRRYDQTPSETEYTAHSGKRFADERAKVGDVVMHKPNSPGLHMCAIEGVHLTVEEVTDRYVSVCGDGVRSKWIRIDHGWYEIVKRAEEKRFPKVGEFWRSKRSGSVKRIESQAEISSIGFPVWVMNGGGWWSQDEMEFAFPARKDGEFRIGDEASVYGAPATVLRVDDSSLVHISFADKEMPWVRISVSHLTLRVPAEMRG